MHKLTDFINKNKFNFIVMKIKLSCYSESIGFITLSQTLIRHTSISVRAIQQGHNKGYSVSTVTHR